MKITVSQRNPPFIDGTSQPPETNVIEEVDQIFYLSFINPWIVEKNFFRLAKCTLKNEPSLLIAELNRGDSFYVIANLEGDIEHLSLPEWKKEI